MSTVRFAAAPASSRRDLASPELWDRSLARSRHRRYLAEVGRRARRRRQSISVAVSAVLATVPVLPRSKAVAAPGLGTAVPGNLDTSTSRALQASGGRVVLHFGSEGSLVAAAQRRLNEILPVTHLAVDGIFGPLTKASVSEYQANHHLSATGSIDARTWAMLFNAPVVAFSHMQASTSETGSGQAKFVSARTASGAGSGSGTGASAGAGGGQQPASAGSTGAGSGSSASGSGSGSGSGSAGSQPVAVVTPPAPTPTTSTYVLTNGVALPLPRGYLTGGSIDQGVDYAAPGGTPLYAMGDGVIIGAGISGFGPNTPVLKITSGPLAGLQIYYGHAGSNSVRVGDHVRAGQQISQVGYGIVGISTGPHLEVGFYPPGPRGAGSRMKALIDRLLREHPSGRAWGTRTKTARAASRVRTASIVTSHPARVASRDLASIAPDSNQPSVRVASVSDSSAQRKPVRSTVSREHGRSRVAAKESATKSGLKAVATVYHRGEGRTVSRETAAQSVRSSAPVRASSAAATREASSTREKASMGEASSTPQRSTSRRSETANPVPSAAGTGTASESGSTTVSAG